MKSLEQILDENGVPGNADYRKTLIEMGIEAVAASDPAGLANQIGLTNHTARGRVKLAVYEARENLPSEPAKEGEEETPIASAPKTKKKKGKAKKATASAPGKKGGDAADMVQELLGGPSTLDVPVDPDATAVKKLLPLSEAGQLLGQITGRTHYLGCTRCQADLERIGQTEEIDPKYFHSCPNCGAEFVDEELVYCFASSHKLLSNGRCPACSGHNQYDETIKILTIHERLENHNEGDDAIVAAERAKTEAASSKVAAKKVRKIVREAKRENLVFQVENGTHSHPRLQPKRNGVSNHNDDYRSTLSGRRPLSL